MKETEEGVVAVNVRKKKDEPEGLGKMITRWMVEKYYPGYSIYKTRPPTKGRMLKAKQYNDPPPMTNADVQLALNLQSAEILEKVDMVQKGYYEVGQVSVEEFNRDGKSAIPLDATVGSINPYNEVKGE